MEPTQTPQYMRNAIGQDIPMHLVKPADKLRDELVMDMVNRFEKISKEVQELKQYAALEVDAFLDISASRYNEDYGGKKGNTTLHSYDGQYRIQRSVSTVTKFDESIEIAKNIIDKYLNDQLQGASDELRQIVNQAFDPSKSGSISTSRVLGLRALGINDERWITAMHAISESLKIMSSKVHVRVYKKNEHGEWKLISVD